MNARRIGRNVPSTADRRQAASLAAELRNECAVQGPEGMSLARTEKVIQEAEDIVRAQPEVRVMCVLEGSSLGNNGPNLAQVWVNRHPWEQRQGEAHSVAAMVERLRGPLAAIGRGEAKRTRDQEEEGGEERLPAAHAP